MTKRTITILIMLMFTTTIMAQVNIRIDLQNTKTFDSIFVKSEAKLQTKKYLSAPFGPSVTLQDKESLKPGMYEILGDSTFLGVILIPTEKNQKFSLKIDGEKVTFTNSKENTAYYNYLDNIAAYTHKLDSLNEQFQQAQKSMPQYMLKVFVDSLSACARRIRRAPPRRTPAHFSDPSWPPPLIWKIRLKRLSATAALSNAITSSISSTILLGKTRASSTPRLWSRS